MLAQAPPKGPSGSLRVWADAKTLSDLLLSLLREKTVASLKHAQTFIRQQLVEETHTADSEHNM